MIHNKGGKKKTMKPHYIIKAKKEPLVITSVSARGDYEFGSANAKRWKTQTGAENALRRICALCPPARQMLEIKTVW